MTVIFSSKQQYKKHQNAIQNTTKDGGSVTKSKSLKMWFLNTSRAHLLKIKNAFGTQPCRYPQKTSWTLWEHCWRIIIRTECQRCSVEHLHVFCAFCRSSFPTESRWNVLFCMLHVKHIASIIPCELQYLNFEGTYRKCVYNHYQKGTRKESK